MAKSNNPPVIIEVTPEMADFIEDNCTSNMGVALNALQAQHDGQLNMSREGSERLVSMMEKFRSLRDIVRKARQS